MALCLYRQVNSEVRTKRTTLFERALAAMKWNTLATTQVIRMPAEIARGEPGELQGVQGSVGVCLDAPTHNALEIDQGFLLSEAPRLLPTALRRRP